MILGYLCGNFLVLLIADGRQMPALSCTQIIYSRFGGWLAVQWFHVSEASFMAPGVAALFHWNLSSDKDPEVKKKALKNIDDILQVRLALTPNANTI